VILWLDAAGPPKTISDIRRRRRSWYEEFEESIPGAGLTAGNERIRSEQGLTAGPRTDYSQRNEVGSGDYKVQWDGTGPSVELSIMQGKKVVAKVPAHVVDLEKASSLDAAVVKNNGDGTRSLSEVRLSGKKFSLAVGEEAAKADATK